MNYKNLYFEDFMIYYRGEDNCLLIYWCNNDFIVIDKGRLVFS